MSDHDVIEKINAFNHKTRFHYSDEAIEARDLLSECKGAIQHLRRLSGQTFTEDYLTAVKEDTTWIAPAVKELCPVLDLERYTTSEPDPLVEQAIASWAPARAVERDVPELCEVGA